MIELELPYPPTSNHLYATVRGRRVLSRKAKDYVSRVALAVYRAGSPSMPAGARLAVELDVYPPDRRKRDIANTEKIVTDALVKCGILWDDSLIDRWVIRRMERVEGGKIVVRIEEEPPA